MACPHLSEITRLEPPRLSQSVHREECTQCFDNQVRKEGRGADERSWRGGCIGGVKGCKKESVGDVGGMERVEEDVDEDVSLASERALTPYKK